MNNVGELIYYELDYTDKIINKDKYIKTDKLKSIIQIYYKKEYPDYLKGDEFIITDISETIINPSFHLTDMREEGDNLYYSNYYFRYMMDDKKRLYYKDIFYDALYVYRISGFYIKNKDEKYYLDIFIDKVSEKVVEVIFNND